MVSSFRNHRRILIYSHDTFGLGHLRRCRAIAHALVEKFDNLSVLILSGSPIIGSFDFRKNVDFVRIPGVIKHRNGEYTSLNLKLHIEETIALRASIIKHTAEVFNPDLFLVDKEPMGLRGEIHETLIMLKRKGTPIVLGLRDVLDDPVSLKKEWTRKNALKALEEFYSQVWIYGLKDICNPLEGLPLPDFIAQRIRYTGYLKRTLPKTPINVNVLQSLPLDKPFLLVTAGGGGDGEFMIDSVLKAYEHDTTLTHPCLIIFGPFMQPESQQQFLERVRHLPHVHAASFDAQLETIMHRAVGVVSMGGYNTFCEVISFDKPTLMFPRSIPRQEQLIRVSRAATLGIVQMVTDEKASDPKTMVTLLQALPFQKHPSACLKIDGFFDGLPTIGRLTEELLSPPLPHQDKEPRSA